MICSPANIITIEIIWISVEKGFPKEGQKVLYSDGKNICLGTYREDYWKNWFCYGSYNHQYYEFDCDQNVKYWFPVPDLPKDSE